MAPIKHHLVSLIDGVSGCNGGAPQEKRTQSPVPQLFATRRMGLGGGGEGGAGGCLGLFQPAFYQQAL